jgi:hypothetical protein
MGGGGRAGTVYAAYLIHCGGSPEEVCARVPGVEKDVQRAFLHGYAAGLSAHA